jgi:hypothetical protein
MIDPNAFNGPGPSTLDWVLRSRALLQRSADELDGASLSRLNRGRQAALAQLDAGARVSTGLRWLGATAVLVGVSVLAWTALAPQSRQAAHVVTPTMQPSEPVALDPSVRDAPVAAPDFELLTDAQQLGLLEDLEFYAWLDDVEDDGG